MLYSLKNINYQKGTHMDNMVITLEKEPAFKYDTNKDCTTIKGRMRQFLDGKNQNFYYQLDFARSYISLQKSKLPSMVDPIELSEEEIFKLLGCIARKTRNPGHANYALQVTHQLKILFEHTKLMGDESLDMSLLQDELTGKTEPSYDLIKDEAPHATFYQGGLKGHIFYVFRLIGDFFECKKDSSARFLTSKVCTPAEVRFICAALAEKYPENTELYQKILNHAEEHWKRMEITRQTQWLKEEQTTDPVAFFTTEELLRPFPKVGPVFYEDENGIMQMACKEFENIYHFSIDASNLVMEIITPFQEKAHRPIHVTAVSRIISGLPNDLPPEQEAAAMQIVQLCSEYKGMPENFDYNKALATDRFKLAETLADTDINAGYETAGLECPTIDATQLAERISKNFTPRNATLRQRFEEMKRLKQ